jgi:hypothetical protein
VSCVREERSYGFFPFERIFTNTRRFARDKQNESLELSGLHPNLGGGMTPVA